MALPIGWDADAATALRVVLKAGDYEIWDDETDWANIGTPEDVHRGNTIRAVQRYLAGRAVA